MVWLNYFISIFIFIFYAVCFDLKENVVRCQLACYSVSAHVLSDLVLNFGIHILCTCLQLQVKLVQVRQGLQLQVFLFCFNLSTLLFRRYCRSTSVTVWVYSVWLVCIICCINRLNLIFSLNISRFSTSREIIQKKLFSWLSFES